MIFEVQGRGINVNEAPWDQVIHSAFQPVGDRYFDGIRSIHLWVECDSMADERTGCRCHAKLALKNWPAFEIVEHGTDASQTIERTAESVLRALAVVLRSH
ncbi:MAG TPA: hypothetical protein VG713_00215 [Pirellulales bacterium]|jgi:hypothetical protein|nr:hypothetical protein [Pirellulales bacterium]